MNKNFTIPTKWLSIFIIGIMGSSLFASNAFAEKNPRKKYKSVVVYNDDEVIFSTNGNDFPFDLKYKGIIEVSNDDQMINSISPNGFVEINKTAFGNNRRLYIHADDKGQLTYEYFVGKSKTSFEPEGKKWLGEILPNIVKKSDLGIESRVRRIYSSDGLRAVLDQYEEESSSYSYSSKWKFFTIESYSGGSRKNVMKTLVFDNQIKDQDIIPILNEIAEIRSNSTKGTLIRYILENYELNTQQLSALLEATATHDYNTERGSTLRMFNKQYSDDFTIRKAYFDIIDDMEINSEKGNVIKDLLKKKKLSNDSWISLLNVVEDFSSEREQGAVLLYCIPYLPKNDAIMNEFRSTLDDMSDSYYVLKGEITTALLDASFSSGKTKTDKTALISYLKTAENISSNSQRGLILRKANRLFINDEQVIEAYFQVLSGVDSDMEKYNVMLDLLNKNKLNEQAMYQLLRQVSPLTSDFQHGAGAVLREVIKQFPLQENNTNQLFNLINQMDQASTIEELLRLVIDHPEMNDEMTIKIIEATQQIDVDVEKAAVLVRLSPQLPGKNSSVRYVFKSMAKELESEYEKNRVLKTIQ
ncbi:hypothetical protein [Carboxylicivirga sp. N1Y90]|uniref:hypothetical protein n=1 Tax=Carboxylicivirga fragile TaxID=3417571 RepID=UPI003D33DCBE|nr:hypothetical protein [Marinilabiliaceae bacterium N1Y90]